MKARWTLSLPQTSRANPVQCCSTHQKKGRSDYSEMKNTTDPINQITLKWITQPTTQHNWVVRITLKWITQKSETRTEKSCRSNTGISRLLLPILHLFRKCNTQKNCRHARQDSACWAWKFQGVFFLYCLFPGNDIRKNLQKKLADAYDKILRVEYGNFKASSSSITSFLWRREIEDQQVSVDGMCCVERI